MAHSEVGLGLLALWWLGLLEVGVFAKMLIVELLAQSKISSLRHDALLIKHRDDTQGLQ
jgi:hypothetical protein